MITRIEQDPEGLGPDIKVQTQMDEHHGHEWERTETLYDNHVEHTVHGYCHTCNTHFWVENVELA